MGDKIPLPVSVAPVPAGDLATSCWGVGKAFGDVPTPSQIILRISGVIKSDLWVPSDGDERNGEFLLTQLPANPFVFTDMPVGPTVAVIFVPIFMSITVFSTTGIPFFSYVQPPACELFVNNGIENPFKGGTARIWLPKVQV